MSKYTLKALAFGVAASLCVSSAQAAFDTAYNAGDLIMGFQATAGSDAVLELNLGAAFQYRDSNASTPMVIGNVGGQLSSLYGGANWYENPNLFVGAAAANNNVGGIAGAGTAVNGDFNSTLYYTVARTAAGSVGSAFSTPGSLPGGNISNAAGQMLQYGNSFGTANVTQGSTGIATFDPTPTGDIVYTWDEFNQSGQSAFGNFNISLQDQLGTGWDFNASFAGVDNVVAVMDLYRLSRYTSEFGAAGASSYEGSFILDTAGNISFVAVPEPSSLGLLGLATAALTIFRRRRRTA